MNGLEEQGLGTMLMVSHYVIKQHCTFLKYSNASMLALQSSVHSWTADSRTP
jgi:hypothetical protein